MPRTAIILIIHASAFVAMAATAHAAPPQPSVATSQPAAASNLGRAAATRPAVWAQPITGVAGAPNLHKVSDHLYRGAQPTAEGFRRLKAMGVKTVINLRSFHSDRDELRDTGLRYFHVWAKAHHAEDEDTIAFLKAASDRENWPVFVHCQHGSDRTGTMVAAYRIVVQGWSKDEAVREMTEGGFGFFPGWTNLIRYVTNLDVEAMRRGSGVTPATQPR